MPPSLKWGPIWLPTHLALCMILHFLFEMSSWLTLVSGVDTTISGSILHHQTVSI